MIGMDESTIAAVALTLKLALVTSVLLMLIVNTSMKQGCTCLGFRGQYQELFLGWGAGSGGLRTPHPRKHLNSCKV